MTSWLSRGVKVLLAQKPSSGTDVVSTVVLVEVVNPARQGAQQDQQGVGRVIRQQNFLDQNDALRGRRDAERAISGAEQNHVFLQYQRIQSSLFFEVARAEIRMQKQCPGIDSGLVHQRKGNVLDRHATAIDDALGDRISGQGAQPFDELFEFGMHGVLACRVAEWILLRVRQ